MFDHASIFLLIAGSYTPITILAIKGIWGWTLFGLVWGLAITGIVLKVVRMDRIKHASLALYLIMGWLLVVAIKPMLAQAPHGLLVWLVIGGLIYTLGVVFYACKKIPFNHGIWHLFVLGGSAAHYFGILFYLAI